MTRDDRGGKANGPGLLEGRTLWFPQMSWGGTVALAAAFRSAGMDARVCPDSDARTLDLAARHSSGEECLPARVTLGNLLQVLEQPGAAPARTAFFMPTAGGPCRFGQYADHLRTVLHGLGLGDVEIFSLTCADGYRGFAASVQALRRCALHAVVCGDLLRKMLHAVRPYELTPGDADAAHAAGIADVAAVLERPGTAAAVRLRRLEAALVVARDRFRRVPARYQRGRPLIGVLGEIFCRLTPFTNEDVVRRIERLGGECTLAPAVEWLWYSEAERRMCLQLEGRRWSRAMLGAWISGVVQRRDEHRLARVFAEDVRGIEDPPVDRILRGSAPYLPHKGALGEMTLSVGKAVVHHAQGCDGVVDISPFGCMNAIVAEAVYPRVSADHDGLPIRTFFFDGGRGELDRDLGLFMELARSYQARKTRHREYPARFERPMSLRV
jgi:predicted nucleotide-binding protein (sugar kinase/HSP70/actin superfamily)